MSIDTFKLGNESDSSRIFKLADVPNFLEHPVSILTQIGKPVGPFSIERSDTIPNQPEAVEVMKKDLQRHEASGFFNGAFLNVEDVHISRDGIKIKTGMTDLFPYLASSAHFEGREGENPVRPLAVQATLFSPGGAHVLLERRGTQVADFPDKLSEFGGALNEKDVDLNDAMKTRLKNKWGIALSSEQLIPTGLMRDNAGNIYCAAFAVELTQEQFDEAYVHGRDASADEGGESRRFYMLSTGNSIFTRDGERSIEQNLVEHRGISEWNYLGFYNLMLALAAKGLRTSSEVAELLARTEKDFKETGSSFVYPIERILNEKEE